MKVLWHAHPHNSHFPRHPLQTSVLLEVIASNMAGHQIIFAMFYLLLVSFTLICLHRYKSEFQYRNLTILWKLQQLSQRKRFSLQYLLVIDSTPILLFMPRNKGCIILLQGIKVVQRQTPCEFLLKIYIPWLKIAHAISPQLLSGRKVNSQALRDVFWFLCSTMNPYMVS